jgi:hypothetical protein
MSKRSAVNTVSNGAGSAQVRPLDGRRLFTTAEVAQALSAHQGDDFLLVACPAAGKTLAAGTGAERTAQLAIANPDVVKDLARAQRRNAIGAAA